jgi:hypothetical protein
MERRREKMIRNTNLYEIGRDTKRERQREKAREIYRDEEWNRRYERNLVEYGNREQ